MFEPESQCGVCGEQTALPTVLQWQGGCAGVWREGRRVHREEGHSSWAAGLSWESLSKTGTLPLHCSAELQERVSCFPPTGWEGVQGWGKTEHAYIAPSSPKCFRPANADARLELPNSQLPQERGTWKKCCRNGRFVLAVKGK